MCADYIGAGLPPERFWQITPRLYLTEMKGAAIRMARERGLAWDTAVMSREGVKPPKREDFAGDPRSRRILTPEEQAAAWTAYIAARQAKG